MLLYRYRRVKSALLEIDSGTFHFASREELNDPMEGYVRVYWEGDKAAWDGLFRNYICSVCWALEWFLLGADEERIRHRSVMVDRHKFDDVPYVNCYIHWEKSLFLMRIFKRYVLVMVTIS